MRLLIIEDDKNLKQLLIKTLRGEGYAVDGESDGEKAYFLASTNDYDLLIVDYNLPSLNGREIISRLRQEKKKMAIIMLTVKSELNDKIDLLNLGADDYLSKPFSLSELLARIKAILRRPKTWQNNIIKFSGLVLDSSNFSLTNNGKAIKLSTKEFSLLEYLLQNKGRTVSRQAIMEHVWDMNADPFSNTIEAHISNLRKKIESKQHKLIYTIPNRGYKIDNKK